jgi:hypothetical protein
VIFVTVGTQLPFDRLIEAIDAIAPSLNEPIFAQTGKSTYGPRNIEWSPRIRPLDEASVLCGRARTAAFIESRAYDAANPYALEIALIDSLKDDEVPVFACAKSLQVAPWGELLSTAAKARAFGMNIAFFNRSAPSTALATALMAERVPTLEALAARADVLSLHVPGGTDTRHLIDAALIRHLKPGMILVNTARGTILDEEAVADGLERGAIGAVALDVYAQEPMINPRLLAHPRSVLLPHLGSATIETRTAMGMQVAANLDAFFDNGQAPNRVA